jgi:hypothetical protein
MSELQNIETELRELGKRAEADVGALWDKIKALFEKEAPKVEAAADKIEDKLEADIHAATAPDPKAGT